MYFFLVRRGEYQLFWFLIELKFRVKPSHADLMYQNSERDSFQLEGINPLLITFRQSKHNLTIKGMKQRDESILQHCRVDEDVCVWRPEQLAEAQNRHKRTKVVFAALL